MACAVIGMAPVDLILAVNVLESLTIEDGFAKAEDFANPPAATEDARRKKAHQILQHPSIFYLFIQ
jgi:hypothetical protein